MTFRFVIRDNVTLLFQVAGAAPSPEPQPAPMPIYSDWRPAFDSALAGFATDNWEEVINNGD